ncbi:MAG TPA: DUF5335 family protein [Longimicrobium sp.]|nr:DUF5335 family protein [Longimicrobium sp.]
MSADLDEGRWAEVLKEFSRRNGGRPTRLQLDDAEMGAQWAEVELSFRGAVYEPRYQRVELMLSDGTPDAHLTHSIDMVTGVDVLQDATGRDAMLRLAYPGGQTLVLLGS